MGLLIRLSAVPDTQNFDAVGVNTEKENSEVADSKAELEPPGGWSLMTSPAPVVR